MHSLDFGGLWYTAEVLLDVQCVRVVLLKDHDQVVQHGDAPVESQHEISFLTKVRQGTLILQQVLVNPLNPRPFLLRFNSYYFICRLMTSSPHIFTRNATYCSFQEKLLRNN